MMITVEEAKTKRCQESFAPPLSMGGSTAIATQSTAHFGGAYHHAAIMSPAFCIGPACMAWKWRGETDDGTQTGFCGKAGR